MRPFEYLAARDLDEACSLLSRHKDEAKILSGGQSLVPLLRQRLVAPKYVIDIRRVPGLDYIREDGDALRVGALTTHRAVETSPVVVTRFPMLAEAEHRLAHRQVRNWGTIGGNLSHADPGGDLAPSLIALGAEVHAQSARGKRTIPILEFFTDYLVTVLEPDEIMTELSIPYLKAGSGGAYKKESIRAGDRPIASVAVVITLDGKGDTLKSASIAMGGVGLTPLHAKEASQSLAGKRATRDNFVAAGAVAAKESQPTSDVEGSADYKRHIVGLLTRDMLLLALDRAQSK